MSLLSLVTVPTTATILEVNLSGLTDSFLLTSLLKNLVTTLSTFPRPVASGFLSAAGAAKSRSLDRILVILDKEMG